MMPPPPGAERPPDPGSHDPYGYGPGYRYDAPAPGYGYPPAYPPGYGQPGGYQPGYGYPTPAPPRKSEPVTGWLMLAGAALAIVGAVTPWATAQLGTVSISKNGTEGDGVLTLICAVPILVAGLMIGIGQGRLWASIVGTVFASFTTLIALIDVVDISSRFGDDAYLDVSVGFGLWLTLVAGLAMLAAAITALVRRPPEVQQTPRWS